MAKYPAPAPATSAQGAPDGTGRLVEIKNREDLESWLENRSHEDAMVIASRAALRVAPLLVIAFAGDAEICRATIILPSLRAIAAPWVFALDVARGAEIQKTVTTAIAPAAATTTSIHRGDIYANAAAFAARNVLAPATDAAGSAAEAAVYAAKAASTASGHPLTMPPDPTGEFTPLATTANNPLIAASDATGAFATASADAAARTIWESVRADVTEVVPLRWTAWQRG